MTTMTMVETHQMVPRRGPGAPFLVDPLEHHGHHTMAVMAACLLFSSKEVVARFLTGLMREGSTALEEVVKVVVAMLAVCEALGNNLNEGLLQIIDFTFSALPHTEKQKKLLISLFWRQLVERLEFGDVQVS